MTDPGSLLLEGRQALVTGGGTGIGQRFAEVLARNGAHVVICGRRSEPLEATADRIRTFGGQVTTVVADVTRARDLSELANTAQGTDVLVNNAGYSVRGPWAEVTVEAWREVMTVNVEAPFRLAQLFVPSMVDRGWGRVINIGSVYGVLTGNPYFYPDFEWDAASYITSKHALIGLSKYLAVRVASSGVTVNTISPGMFPDTPANRDSLSEESRARLSSFTPSGRNGQLEDLDSTLLYLASPASSFITGQNIIVDGGWTCW